MRSSRKKAPNLTDTTVGKRVRMRRNMLGMSQTALADALDVTFQQAQKYESGANRISASRLEAIARTLRVPVSFFFFFDPVRKAEFPAEDAFVKAVMDFISTREGISLVKAFLAIKNPKLRHAFASLVKNAGGDKA